MTGRKIITAITAAVLADQQISSWCLSRYGVPVTVYVGWSQDGAPVDGWSYPCVNLALWKITEGDGEKEGVLELDFEADEDDEESGSVVPAPMTRPTAPAAPAPQKTAKAQTKRRRKAIMALRALHRKIGD